MILAHFIFVVATKRHESVKFGSPLKRWHPPGVILEHHLEKTLTFLAFFDGSPKHLAFLEVPPSAAIFVGLRTEGMGPVGSDGNMGITLFISILKSIIYFS